MSKGNPQWISSYIINMFNPYNAEIFLIKTMETKVFIIWNHHRCLSQFFQRGDHLWTSESDVYNRLILPSKDGPALKGLMQMHNHTDSPSAQNAEDDMTSLSLRSRKYMVVLDIKWYILWIFRDRLFVHVLLSNWSCNNVYTSVSGQIMIPLINILDHSNMDNKK